MSSAATRRVRSRFGGRTSRGCVRRRRRLFGCCAAMRPRRAARTSSTLSRYVGVPAGAKLDAHRRSDQAELAAEKSFEVALVGVRDPIERIAVDDDARRVDAALVRIAQLRPDQTAFGRRLLLDGLNQRARE